MAQSTKTRRFGLLTMGKFAAGLAVGFIAQTTYAITYIMTSNDLLSAFVGITALISISVITFWLILPHDKREYGRINRAYRRYRKADQAFDNLFFPLMLSDKPLTQEEKDKLDRLDATRIQYDLEYMALVDNNVVAL